MEYRQLPESYIQDVADCIYEVFSDARPGLLEVYGRIPEEDYTVKGNRALRYRHPLTEYDLEIEYELRRALHQLDPTLGFGGEETGENYDQETFVLADPIDGTEFFIRGIPYCVSQAALIHRGLPILGEIHNIATGERYTGIKGVGAYCNGNEIHVSTRPLPRALVYFNGSRSIREASGFAYRLQREVGIRGALHIAASGTKPHR